MKSISYIKDNLSLISFILNLKTNLLKLYLILNTYFNLIVFWLKKLFFTYKYGRFLGFTTFFNYFSLLFARN